MGLGAGDLGPADDDFPIAMEGAVHQIVHLLDGSGGGHRFENGAGHHAGRQEPVEIHPFIGRIVIADLRGVLRVIGGGGHHAEDLPGFVVIDPHGALGPVQRFIGRGAKPGIQGEGDVGPSGDADAGNRVIAAELARQTGLDAGADAPLRIPHGVESGHAHAFVFAILPFAVLGFGQHHAVSVQHRPTAQAASGVQMLVCRKGGPLAAVDEKPHRKDAQSQHQGPGQKQAKEGPFFNLLHNDQTVPFFCAWAPA